MTCPWMAFISIALTNASSASMLCCEETLTRKQPNSEVSLQCTRISAARAKCQASDSLIRKRQRHDECFKKTISQKGEPGRLGSRRQFGIGQVRSRTGDAYQKPSHHRFRSSGCNYRSPSIRIISRTSRTCHLRGDIRPQVEICRQQWIPDRCHEGDRKSTRLNSSHLG